MNNGRACLAVDGLGCQIFVYFSSLLDGALHCDQWNKLKAETDEVNRSRGLINLFSDVRANPFFCQAHDTEQGEDKFLLKSRTVLYRAIHSPSNPEHSLFACITVLPYSNM